MRSEGAHLFVFAHPDDESACMGVIEGLARRGADVRCTYLTDGAHGGQPAERRQRESLAVLAALGVARTRVRFEEAIPDGRLHRHLGAALAALGAHELVQALYVPAWEGGHQDHDAAHLAGLLFAQELGIACRQFPLYHGAGLIGPLFRVLDPLPQNGAVEHYPAGWRDRLRYARLCLGYPSQWRSWIGLYPFFLLRLLQDRAFHLQPVNPRRVAQAPHAGRLLYERRGGCSAAEFGAAVAPFAARLVGQNSC